MSESQTNTYRFSIRRPVTVAMLFITLLVFGWRSYDELPINLMPNISYPTLTVRTEYEGAAPEDVVELVTRPLEERLSVVNGIVEISSISSPGLSEIILEFAWGTNMNLAMQNVRESLDLYAGPQGLTRKPIILRYDPTLDPIMRVAISGRDVSEIPDVATREARIAAELTAIREAAERQIKNDLEAEVGIAQILVTGGREEEIQILVDAQRLKDMGLALQNVVQSLDQHNINLSGGRLREGRTEYLVRTLNEFQDIEEIRSVVIRTPSGDQLRLEDVALVQMGEKERQTIVRVNGQEAVELEIYKEGDANTVEVCNKLKDFFNFERKQSLTERLMLASAERMPAEQRERILTELERKKRVADKLRSRLPDYAKTTLITDQSRFITASIREVQQTALIGGALALLVLFLFLNDIKSTSIIGVAIPISVIATFVPMFVRDVSLNIMSLGGLALGIGMLVDNSIVVLESIFRCREEGDSPVDAAERGTREVSSAVTASTLTTIAVFMPIVFVEGIAGQMFRDLALTVTFSLIASLLVALYLIPMIASRTAPVLTSEGQVVWLLRGYFEGREQGEGRARSLLRIPARSVRYIRNWFAGAWSETVGLNWRGMLGRTDGETEPSIAGRIGYGIALPVVFGLFLLQVLLKCVSAIGVTLLFGFAISVAVLVWTLGKLFHLLLALPVHVFNRAFNAARGVYVVVLRQALHFSPLILLLVLGVAIHAVQVAGSLGRELIPPMKQGEFGIRMEGPPGTRLEDTERRSREIEALVRAFPQVESVTTQIGAEDSTTREDEGENIATLTVQLRNPAETVRIQDALIEQMRGEILAITPYQVTFTLPTLFSFKSALEVQVYGDDLTRLRELSRQVLAQVEEVRGVKDADVSLKRGYPEVVITFDPELLAEKNLAPNPVATRVRTEVQGDVATRFSRGVQKIDVRVRADQDRLQSVQDLRTLSVTDGFPPIPLETVAKIEIQEGPSQIRRIDQQQVALISANVEGRDLGGVARDIEGRLAQLNWPDGYSYALGGQQRDLETSYGGLLFALLMAVFLVYVVMACQFESMWHPALIMFSVPLAFIGVIHALDWMGVNVSVIVFIGGIVLAGIVVNAAIVLVDYINQLRARGLSKADAVVEACRIRFRPILMTAMTTVLGLIPMVLSTGEGAEIRRPMAITVMAGLSSATVLTLLVIPLLYYFATGRDKPAAGKVS